MSFFLVLFNSIIVPTSGYAHHVPFASLTLADLNMVKDDFARAIRHSSRLESIQGWDEVMIPIVYVFQHGLKLWRRSQIWLYPTAVFTLHEAHLFRTNADRSGGKLCLEDIYIYSYTPTLSALMKSRQATKIPVTPSSMDKVNRVQGKTLVLLVMRLHRQAFSTCYNATLGDHYG